MPVRVAIVEDDAGIRESLSVLINGSPGFRCVSAFPSAEAALKQLPNSGVDVALMDINLPRMSGIECAARIKNVDAAMQIIMLTVYDETEKIFESLQLGASGYLIKDTPPSEILEAMLDVCKGGSPMSSHIARKVVQFFQKKKRSPVETENLSARETEILTHLAKGFRYKEIADVLGISVLTVRGHLRRIYEKLHVRSRTEAVVKFLGKESLV